MLQIKNLKKEYRTKGGVVTKALDDVSITFPEKGLVFLLGKSGSGKSTLLNVVGGLDKADSGEIIIKGKNSKEFTQSDFDSYRNTYIGFVFQEYNILNEFNIEQNIALALQLQGKKHNKEAVDAILKQVGLEQFGRRKPNTLSGGQKQRVAIARALIKNPEIIMADEPTGALDSNTGKQIFDTLKELSKEKLVIVVSHDRDFAEIYADRIIELADGKIISDTSKELIKTKEMGNIHVVNDHTLAIKDVEKVSKKDIDVILDNLKNQKGEVLITSGDHDLPLVRQAIHLSDDNSSEVFKDTKDVKTKEYDPKQTKFIRSHLPFGRAFKMGASYLKLKPVRLIFTSLLTIISLTLFGVASTLLFFKDSYAYSNALKDAPYNSEVVSKSYAVKVRNHRVDESGNDEVRYENDTFFTTAFSKEEINSFNENNLNLKFAPVMTFRLPESYYYSSSSTNYIVVSEPSAIGAASYYQYAANPSGFVSSNKKYIDSVNGLSLQYGEYPAKEDEVAISSYASDYFVKAFGVNSADQLLDETISVSINGNIGNTKVDLTIKGIIKTPDLDSTYDDLKQDTSNSANLRSLKEDFADYMKNDFASFLYVSENFGESFISEIYSPESNTSGNKSISLLLQGIEFSSDSSIEYQDVDENRFYGSVVTEKSAGDSVKNMTFYDTKLAQTTYRAPNDDEVYLPYENVNQEISSMYSNYMVNIMNFVSGIKDGWSDSKNYVPALRSLTTEELEELYNKADGLSKSMYGGGTFDPKKFEQKPVFQELKTFYETNYYEYIGNEYLRERLQRYFELYEHYKTQRTLPTDKYPDDILDIKSKREALEASYPNYDFSEKETFINCLTNDPMPLYLDGALNIFWDLRYDGSLDKWGVSSSTISDLESLRSKYFDTNTWLSEEEQERVKAFIDDIYENHPEVEESYGTPGFEMPRNYTDFTPTLAERIYYKNYRGEFGQLKVIGFYRAGQNYGWCNFVSDNFVETKAIVMDDKGNDSGITNYTEYVTDYTLPEKAYYSGMITPSGYSQEQVEFMQQEFGNAARLNLTNSVARTVASSLSLISILKPTFLGIGAALAVFASLMLLNYVSASITTKTKEIGILRAVGARGSDLFKIFFSESGLMSAICLVISIIASVIVVWRINEVFKSGLMKAALLNFGVLNILVIIGGAILITVLGTIIPVIIASKKQPVESIRTL